MFLTNLKEGEIDLRLPLAMTGLIVVFIGFTCVKGKKSRGTGELLKELEGTSIRELTNKEASAIWKISSGEADRHLRLIKNAYGAQDILENLRKEKYDSDNKTHEELLERLWSALRPNIKRSGRISDDWEDIGFQGNNPATDFRGNGILGLLNLVYFAENHSKFAIQIINDAGYTNDRSQSQEWYMMAVAGINMTTVVSNWLTSRQIDRFFYNIPLINVSMTNTEDMLTNPAVIAHSQVYSSLFLSFHKTWLVKRPGIMEFSMFLNGVVVPANDPSKIQKEA